ncbi:MFS transporter [Solibacillus sp. A46]|uniref:MFS transporter n=1 Tax=Solibacillus faecavium TaxID=2762221 RepID=A0ABR8Y141_9BACL|nr:MFS transporter [Solibacillus faecavium]MBD8037894.1 MFS transporter [Solibacillus faecavium]
MDKQNSKYRWIVFASVLLTYLLMASQRTAPGLITDQLMNDFNITATTIGFITGVQFFVYTSLQIPMGILADRFGPNFFLIVGAVITGVGTVFYSVGTHEYVLFLSRILTGLGDATIWVNMMLILGQWFHKKEFVRLVGFAGMTGSLGFLLATVPFSAWIQLLGWRGAFFSLGAIVCLCGLLLYVVLIKNTKQTFIKPVVEKEQILRERTGVIVKRVFSNRQAWALFFCHFGVVGGYVGFISSWAVPFGMDMYGMTRSEASQLIMVGLVGAILGAPLMSWVASMFDTIKKPYITVHLIVLSSWITFLFFKGYPSIWWVIILFFLIGFGYGASALTFAAVRRSFPLEESGIVSGFANTGGFLSAVLLPIFLGAILDYVHGSSGMLQNAYYYGFIIPVVFSVIGLGGMFLFREMHGPE